MPDIPPGWQRPRETPISGAAVAILLGLLCFLAGALAMRAHMIGALQ